MADRDSFPQANSTTCTLALGRGALLVYSQDTKAQVSYLYASGPSLPTNVSYWNRVGLEFCKPGFQGDKCTKACPGASLYSSLDCNSDDLTNLEIAEFSCTNNGNCSKSGVCQCDSEYQGDQCETRDCPNNCSNDKITDDKLKSTCKS